MTDEPYVPYEIPSPPDLDLGLDHELWYFQWSPDRDLNQYADLDDLPKAGALVSHLRPDNGLRCRSAINFDFGPTYVRIQDRHNVWQVQCWEPLTVTPSLKCGDCGDHGFVTEGRWVPA